MASRSNTLGEMAAATPDSRDRYVDLLRAFSIAVVVLGHWLMAVVYFDGARFEGASALDVVPGLWLATWVLQVMPLFFFVGGFSNLVAWRGIRRRNETYATYLRTRTTRLMRPTMVFVAAWTIVAGIAATIAPASFEAMSKATELLAKPLWFLAVYVLVVALAPVMAAFHERFGARVLVALFAAAAIVDVIRIAGDLTVVGYLNFAFVWLFAHQLGYFYADGALRLSRRLSALAAVSSLSVLALLTGSGIYSPSMVGMRSEAASNNSPPTICLIVLTLWLVSVAMLLRPAASRWLQRPRNWTAVIAANSMIMTVFLWHLTALLVAVLVLYPLGFPQPVGGTGAWWAWRPLWLVALSTILAGFVVAFGRFERPSAAGVTDRRVAMPRFAVAGGVVALVAGLAGFAQFGFAFGPAGSLTALPTQPFFNAALVVAGYRVLTSPRTPIGG
ncbi:MAG TPA: acyltransferase [Actinomycetota bacterium]|nr:acyltransferase [Actinomycetota bacterium]